MMKNKDKVEYIDFKSLSEEKKKMTNLSSQNHTNPFKDKLFKFLHTKLTKFNPEDIL